MTKRSWKEFMQGLYENHIDSRKDEELRNSKTEVENKLPKIIKLVKERRLNKRNRNTELLLKKESELIGLIEDFHKQYQFVYGQYDDLRGKLSETANGGKEEEGFFTSTSSSDSETESEKNIKTDHGRLNQQKKSFYSEYIEAVNKAKENEKIMQELKEKLDEKGREISSLAKMQKLHQIEISGLMKKLESELSSYNHKLNGMCPEKKASEQQVENKGLLSQVSKLEQIVKEVDEKNGVKGAVEETEVSKIKGLIVQVNCLKLNVDCLFNAQKIDSEKQKLHQSNDNNIDVAMHENLLDQMNEMKRDLGLMRKKNTELESSFEKKTQENSEILSQIDDLKKEVTEKGQELQKMQKDKEDSSNYRSETEKIIAIKEQEIEELQEQIVNMEKVLKEREDQFTALKNRLESAQVTGLMTPFNHNEQEIELKNESEIQIKINDSDISNLTDEKESLKGRISELEKKLENQNDQQFMIKQQEDTINKLKEDCQLMKGRLLQAANRKMDEVAEEFRKNFEDQLRMLTRRIRVAEQLQAETKESCKKMQEHCQQQHPSVLEKRFANHRVIVSPQKSELQLKTVLHQAVDELKKDMDLLISNFNSKEGSFSQRLSSVTNEIQVATNWVRSTMNEIKPCKNNEQLGSPYAFALDDKEQDKIMKENSKVKKLEAKVNKEKGDKLKLMRGMYEMQKKVSDLENAILEKDEGLSRLGNEKVEAIRQLCIWNDYQQSQFDQLKKVMLVKKTKSC